MKSERLIYSISCPFTNEIHYIGKSTKGMIRPLQHLSNSHSDKVKEWISNLQEIGHKPKIDIIEFVPLGEDLDGRERYWIQYYLNKGNILLNSCLTSPLLIQPDLDVILGNGKGMEMLKIGNFIKEKRKSVNLDQKQFAEKCGIALTVLRKIEQGKTNFNVDGLLIALKMFGCSIDVTKIKK